MYNKWIKLDSPHSNLRLELRVGRVETEAERQRQRGEGELRLGCPTWTQITPAETVLPQLKLLAQEQSSREAKPAEGRGRHRCHREEGDIGAMEGREMWEHHREEGDTSVMEGREMQGHHREEGDTGTMEGRHRHTMSTRRVTEGGRLGESTGDKVSPSPGISKENCIAF